MDKWNAGRLREVAQSMAPLKAGQYFLVLWRDKKKLVLAEILERRAVGWSEEGSSSGKGKGAAVSKHEDSDGGLGEKGRVASDFEYYVHYCEYDRRLDEWVGVDRIDLVSGEQAAPPSGSGSGHGHHHHHGGGGGRKRRFEETAAVGDGARGNDKDAAGAPDREHEEITKVKNIGRIDMGRHSIETWYYSPFPQEYCNVERLIVCEFCLKYMKLRKTMSRHRQKCELRHPPGDEVYREGNLSVFEVDGKANKIYCQNLCLLAKLFLDHKTLYYDVDPFLFYVLCETDDRGCHVVGYFSKEKNSTEGYNLACILTFPPYQRSGYGKFLISLSYELSKLEGKLGSPEKPLSDLGKLSYKSYWAVAVLSVLKQESDLTLKDICKHTGMKPEDVVSTLKALDMLRVFKGQYVIAVRINVVQAQLAARRKMRLCKPECLNWTRGTGGGKLKEKEKTG